MDNKGFFITIEGGEGAGKTTLIKSLCDHLQGKRVDLLKTRAPGGTPFGEKIRSLLLHEEKRLESRSELFLFLADRADHVESVIKPALLKGKMVICDRFNDSTVAYQGVGRGHDPDYVRNLCEFATKGLEPDLTFYLDIDPEEGLKRVMSQANAKDRIESESVVFHQKIREAFCLMAQKEPTRIRILDATQPPHVLLEQAIDVLYAVRTTYR